MRVTVQRLSVGLFFVATMALLVGCPNPTGGGGGSGGDGTNGGDSGGGAPVPTGPVVTSDAASGPGSLLEAVTNADPGSVVTFGGDYTIVATAPLPATPAPTWFDIAKDITIDGTGRSVVLDAAEFGRHFTIRDTDPNDGARPTLTLRNLTLRNGLGRNTDDSPANGGAIYNYLAALVLENVTIENNRVTKDSSQGGSGGAVVVQGGPATLTGSSFENNVASQWGGAIFVIGNASLTIENTTFRNNRIANTSEVGDFGGGAIHVQAGSQARIVSSIFEDNSTAGAKDGGALDLGGGADVIASRFVRNSAGRRAGAILLRPTSSGLRVHGSLFLGNRSLGTDNGGGAIRSTRIGGGDGAPVTIVSSVFVGNEADGEGGALRLGSTSHVSLSTFVDNSSGFSGDDIRIERGVGVSNSLILRDSVDVITPVSSSVSDADLTAYGSENVVATVALVEEPNPGLDGNWGSADDNYGDVAPDDQSAALNVGDDSLIPGDILDLDGDGNTSEPWPYDVLGNPRKFGNFVDMAAHENQNSNASPGRPLAPTFHPEPGRHALNTQVSILSEISTATIYYTTDGTAPDPSDLTGPTETYMAPILVEDNTVPVTINAVAQGPSGLLGEVSTGTFTAFPMDTTITGGLLPLVARADGGGTAMRSRWAGVVTHEIGSTAYAYVTADEDSYDNGITVLEIGATGELTPIQTILDTGSMNLDGARYPSIVEAGGTYFLAVAGAGHTAFETGDDGISVFEIASDGRLTHRDAVDASAYPSLTGIHSTTAINVGGFAFVIAAARGTNALTVFELSPSGHLSFADSVADSENPAYELDSIGVVKTFYAHGNAYVTGAGFADDGFSIFRLANDGQLTHIASETDDSSRFMRRVSGISPATVGNSTYIITAGRDDNGLSVFEFTAMGALSPVQDVSDAASSAALGNVEDIAVYNGATGDYLIVADRFGGISLFAMSTGGSLSFEELEPDTASLLLSGNMSLSLAERNGVPILVVASAEDGAEGAQSILIE